MVSEKDKIISPVIKLNSVNSKSTGSTVSPKKFVTARGIGIGVTLLITMSLIRVLGKDKKQVLTVRQILCRLSSLRSSSEKDILTEGEGP